MSLRFLQFIISCFLASVVFTACQKDNVTPTTFVKGFGTADTLSIVTELPFAALPRPFLLTTDSIPTVPMVCANASRRNGVSGTLTTGTITGSIVSDIPTDLLALFTQGNKPLSQTESSDTIKGWNITQMTAINPNSGAVADISNRVNKSVVDALSGSLTYFPDGYYTFVSNQPDKQHLNQFGWYQIVLEGGLPIGIVYNIYRSGATFSDSPLYPGPTQGHGVWGIDKLFFFPTYRLSKNEHVMLRMQPIRY